MGVEGCAPSTRRRALLCRVWRGLRWVIQHVEAYVSVERMYVL